MINRYYLCFQTLRPLSNNFISLSQVYVFAYLFIFIFESDIYMTEHERKATRNYLMNAYIKQLYKALGERKSVFHPE